MATFGFSVHNEVKTTAEDTEGRRTVAEYILRSPFALEKMRYQAKTGSIIYRSKMHPVLKRNFEVFSALDWLGTLTADIPNHDEPLVRYYGWYSNVCRGKRRKAREAGGLGEGVAVVEVVTRAARRTWSASSRRSMKRIPAVPALRGSHADPCLHPATRGYRKDPRPLRAVAGPLTQPTGGGPGTAFSATGRRRLAPPRDPTPTVAYGGVRLGWPLARS